MLALYPDEEVERASRCHGHQQKVIASRHEFDTCPVTSTHPIPGFRWKPGVSVPGSGRRACRDLAFADFPAGIIETVEEDVSSSQKVSRTCE